MVFLVLGLAGGVWYSLQPRTDQPALLCKPVNTVAQWLTTEETSQSVWGQKATDLVQQFNARCAERVGAPTADLAAQARTRVDTALHQAKALTNRPIEAVTGPDRLRIAGLGEARLLGVTVPPAKRDAAVAYLSRETAGQRLAITVATDRDPEQRPLVVVTLGDGTSLNAQLIRRGLATPWKGPGPWREWTVPTRAEVASPPRGAAEGGVP